MKFYIQTIVRIVITIILIFFAYKETGAVTALCFILIFIFIEAQAIFNRMK